MPTAVAEFQSLLGRLSHSFSARAGRLMSRLDRLTVHETRVFLTDAYPELAWPFLHAAAELSAVYYGEQSSAGSTSFVAEPVVLASAGQLAVNARWATTQDRPVEAVQGSAQRAVFDASRDTIIGNAELEPGTRWARYASSNACGFCRLLATAGAKYRSAESATQVVGRSVNLTVSDRRAIAAGTMTWDEALERRSVYRSARQAQKAGREVGDKLSSIGEPRGSRKLGEPFHDNCRCLAVPVRPGDTYEPPPYVEQWQQDYRAAVKEARAAGKGRDFKAIVRGMDARRRAQLKDGSSGGALETVDHGLTATRDQGRPEPATGGAGGGDDGGTGNGGGRTGLGGPGDDDRPPPRVKGMLGPNTDDEFGVIGDYEPAVRRSEIRTFTHDEALSVLDGDDPDRVVAIRDEIRAAIRNGESYTVPHGGHRHGTGWGKNEFDPGWDGPEVLDFASALIDTPIAIIESEFGFKVYGVYRGRRGVVVVNHDGSGSRGWHVVTTYPAAEV